MICKLVGLIKAARIGLARFTYSSSHTCAYDYVIELSRFFGYYHLLCVPFMHDACFHKAGKSVLYKLICLVTANAGLMWPASMDSEIELAATAGVGLDDASAW